jgi:signal peptide peptidase SppA
MDINAHMAALGSRRIEDVPYEMSGDIAVVDINGTMTKKGSSLSDAGSSVKLRQVIRSLARNESVAGIMLRLDTPGGSVSGIDDLGREVAAARQYKPVYAFVEDLTASAGYWVASQADAIYASNKTAEIGSIGVYMAIHDVSRWAENQGVDTIVIRTSPLKGAGVEGERITDEAKAYWQELVDGIQSEFKAAVKTGRKMTDEQINNVSTGRVWMAEDARQLGLIDGIQSFDATLEQLSAAAAGRLSNRRNSGGKRMSKETTAASYVEIIEACDGLEPKTNAADAKFICDQMDVEATAAQATKAWMSELKKRATDAQDTAKEAAKKNAAKDGVSPIEDGTHSNRNADGDVAEQWQSAIDEQVRAGKSRSQAVLAVAKKNPSLHQSYIDAANNGGKA